MLDRNFYSVISSETWNEYIKLEEKYLKYLEVYIQSNGKLLFLILWSFF